MKNKRIVASLVAALSSFASSMAAGNGGNVKIMSRGGQSNVTSRLNGNKTGALSSGQIEGKNLTGRKRYRGSDSASPSGAGRNSKGKNSVNSEHGKESDKNSNFGSASKNFDGNKPVSFKSDLEKTSKSKKTITPGVTGVGIPVAGLGTTIIGNMISSKVFKRSIIDKIKYGITVQGVVDYFKKNTRFVTKQIDNKTIALLELDLGNNKKMFVHAYAKLSYFFGMTSDYKLIFADSIESVQVNDLKLPNTDRGEVLLYDGTAGYGECKNSSNNSLSFVYNYTLGLRDLIYYNTKVSSDLENSVFKGIDFSKDEANYVREAIEPHIEQLVSDLKNRNPDLQVVKFKKSEQPSN